MEGQSQAGHAAGDSRAVYRSWKAIAGHFGASVRTVQHWELDRGLPVHRMPGERGRVYAFVDELEAWRGSAGVEPDRQGERGREWRKRGWAVGAAIGVAAVVAASYWWVQSRPRPESWAVEGRDLVALGQDGEPLWRHTFPKPLWRRWMAPVEGFLEYRTMPVVADFDGDGAREVAAVYWPKDEPAEAPEVWAFDSNGRPEWRYRVRPAVTAAGRPLDGPYDVRMLFPAPQGGGQPPALVVVSNQRGGFASQVAVLSPGGVAVREYWHSGHILHAEMGTAAGCETVIYLGARHAATGESEILALDVRLLGSASEESEPQYQIKTRTPGAVAARVRFPATELARQLAVETAPTDVRIRDGRVVLSVSQSGAASGGESPAIVNHSADLTLRDFQGTYARTFSAMTDRLAAQGKVKRYDMEADLRRIAAARVIVPWRHEACGAQAAAK